MRMRSPRIEPPVIGLDGSTATMPTVLPRGAQLGDERVDERRLAGARHAGDADDVRLAALGVQAVEDRRRPPRPGARAG